MKKKMDTAIFPDGDKETFILERFLMLGLDQDDRDDKEP
jgi:hypothetical protein